MRGTTGRSSRVSTKLKLVLASLIALVAVGAFGATTASAAQQLKMNFTDGWIRVPAIDTLSGPGGGTFHAVDPSVADAPTIALTGALAKDGSFTSKASDFNFPTQHIDAGATLGTVDLEITAIKDITGSYNQSTGAFSAALPLKLIVRVPNLNIACQISPLNIPLASTGTIDFLTDNNGPGELSGAPFASGTGSTLGSWTDVTVDDVTGVDGTPTSTALCQGVIQGLIGTESSFEGSIWLAGTSAVTGTVDPDVCAAGTHGTPPNCVKDEVIPPGPTPAKITKAKASPGKLTIKRKKKGTLKVAVTNGGGSAATNVKVCATAPAKLVAKPKCVTIKSIAAGKSATAAIKFTAKKKKGQGKIKVTVSSAAGKAKASANLKIK